MKKKTCNQDWAVLEISEHVYWMESLCKYIALVQYVYVYNHQYKFILKIIEMQCNVQPYLATPAAMLVDTI